MLKNRLFNWFFYGHVLIALAAAGLSATSIYWAYGTEYFTEGAPILLFLFTATLGVYTLHRLLSFRRAGVRPTTLRYNIVDRHPWISLSTGICSLVVASFVLLPYLRYVWQHLLWAVPITVFYLTPPLRGWRRLRDLPYVKVIWVAWAWTLMTSIIPVGIMQIIYADHFGVDNPGICFFGGIQNPHFYDYTDMITRFLFTGSIALLFDFRDVILDRSQEVKTVANDFPVLTKWLVTASMVVCVMLVVTSDSYLTSSETLGTSLAYLAVIPAAWMTNTGRSEHWYAIVINGLLLGPVVALGLAKLLG